MNQATPMHTCENGFTLIEVIATVIVMGILAAFFMHFMGTALEDSWQSVEVVADEAKAEGLMEKIIADYVEHMNGNNFATALQTIKDDETTYENDSGYGMPVTMEYIVFDSNGVEQPDTAGQNRNLKVTVESPGEDLTTILTQGRRGSDEPPMIY